MGQIDAPIVLRRFRPTIMSGYVVDYATAFRDYGGLFGMSYEEQGPFHISASRDAVIVHRAELSSEPAIAAFREALADAHRVFDYLHCWDKLPEEIRNEHNAAEDAWRKQQASEAGVQG